MAVDSVRMLLAEATGPEAYRCCVCFDDFKVAEYVWSCRHIVCNVCAPKLNACPVCRTTDVPSQVAQVALSTEMLGMVKRLHLLATGR